MEELINQNICDKSTCITKAVRNRSANGRISLITGTLAKTIITENNPASAMDKLDKNNQSIDFLINGIIRVWVIFEFLLNEFTK